MILGIFAPGKTWSELKRTKEKILSLKFLASSFLIYPHTKILAWGLSPT